MLPADGPPTDRRDYWRSAATWQPLSLTAEIGGRVLQDMDYVTAEQLEGLAPLKWLEFQVTKAACPPGPDGPRP